MAFELDFVDSWMSYQQMTEFIGKNEKKALLELWNTRAP
jgi:predicted DNA-binding ArsR family transcriptional regulator